MDKPKNFIKNKHSKNILAYGFPHRGGDSNKEQGKKNLKRLCNICYQY